MHQPPIALRQAHRKRRRSRLAKRLLTLVAPLLLGPIAGQVSATKSGFSNEQAVVASAHQRSADFETSLRALYADIAPQRLGLRYEVFREAMVGYLNLRRAGELDPSRKLLTVIDFEQSSSQKRLYVLDLEHKKVLFNTLVAHGRGSGDDTPDRFSNQPDSHMSSLGFFVTGETYEGKHGYSLHLNGKDEGFNSNAFNRSVVMHAADYVSEDFVKQHGHLGRSHGCPALPPMLNAPIINQLKNGTCLFLYSPVERLQSRYLDQQVAMETFFAGGQRI